jgi:aldose 1-epimerase
MPGVQLYTACNDPAGPGFKGGATYEKYGAVCFETQYFPNASAFSHFPQPLFTRENYFCSETVFTLSEL